MIIPNKNTQVMGIKTVGKKAYKLEKKISVVKKHEKNVMYPVPCYVIHIHKGAWLYYCPWPHPQFGIVHVCLERGSVQFLIWAGSGLRESG